MKHLLPALLMIRLLFLSCGKRDDRIKLLLWNFGGTPPMIEWVRARVDSFNATHPGLRVVQSQKSWNMIRELLYTNTTRLDPIALEENFCTVGESGRPCEIDISVA